MCKSGPAVVLDMPSLATSVALEVALVLILGLVGVGASAAVVTVLLVDPLFGLLFFLDARLLDRLDLESVEEVVEVRRIIWLGGPRRCRHLLEAQREVRRLLGQCGTSDEDT